MRRHLAVLGSLTVCLERVTADQTVVPQVKFFYLAVSLEIRNGNYDVSTPCWVESLSRASRAALGRRGGFRIARLGWRGTACCGMFDVGSNRGLARADRGEPGG